MELIREGLNKYRLERRGKMQVDALVFINESLLAMASKDKSLQQLANAACLPGVYKWVCGMPDIHEGFGLPIGGVMATVEGGVISAGAVGMDINCGVRLLSTKIDARDLTKDQLRRVIDRIEHYVPTGIGKKGRHKGITEAVFSKVVHTGSRGIVELGYGRTDDVRKTEEEGCLAGADIAAVGREAQKRGAVQMGTLGGGNHFIELQIVEETFDRAVGEDFGLFPGQLTVMIHTGSRGFGHQICNDYSRSLLPVAKKHGIDLPERGLACAPVDSREGRNYYAAMACAVNFAFANRQLITHDVRLAFGDVFGCQWDELGLDLVYDVAHNIAKWERHFGQLVLVHRKGATRALPPGHLANPVVYRHTGHPVLIPGSMGTASYVLTGTDEAAESFYSANHGAGRILSRTAAAKKISREEFEQSMAGIIYNVRDYRDMLDEAPGAYKDIDQVVEVLAAAGMTRKVARMLPLAVIKGRD